MRLDAPTTPLLLYLLSLSSLFIPAAAARPKDAILLSEVQSLTLRSPGTTTSRRVAPIPQLTCVSSPSLCRLADIKTMRCTNQGASYTSQDIEWACAATLPSTLQLDRTEVICEGYAHADDAYVLRGSCGVEYTVRLTEEGRRVYPGLVGKEGKGRKGRVGGGGEGGDWAGWVFGAVFLGVLGWIVWNAFLRAGENRRLGGGNGGNNRRRPGGGGGGGGWGPGWGPGGGGGGGGGGGNGWDDPPPPYPGTGPKPSSSSASSSWRPGFWSGLAGGAAAGYMAGSRGQRNNNDRNLGRGGGLWGNNGGSGSWGSDSNSNWGAGRRSSSSSGARHESTGYGSTSRR